MKLVVTLKSPFGNRNVNVQFEETTPGALQGLGFMTEDIEVDFDQPLIVFGITLKGVNE